MEGNQPDKLDEQLNEGLDLQHDSCYFCNGFYGPNFGEPICGTCHDFLYSEDFEMIDVLHRPIPVPIPAHLPVHGSSSIPLEKDDGDSGNDEPSEEAGPAPPPPPLPPPPNLWGVDGGNESGESESDDSIDEAMLAMGVVAAEAEAAEAEVPVEEVLPGGAWALAQPQPPPPEPNEKMARRLAQLTIPDRQVSVPPNNSDLCSNLPPEMWTVIFAKLDATSILMVSKVCRKWKTIVQDQFPDSFWEEYIRTHWPLVRPIYQVESWYYICSDLIDSLPCKACFFEMKSVPHIDMAERSLRQVRLEREIKWLRLDHPEGIEATPLDDRNYNWLARINGPADSPYQGGVFYMNLKIHQEYPLKPPVVRFLTKIFHPNISRHGDVGIDCIQHNWTLALTFAKVLLSVQSLLTDPCTDAYMEACAANLYLNDRTQYDKVARVWTWKYAMHDILVH